MAYVKCKYCEEEYREDPKDLGVVSVYKYIAGEYKRVNWDGEVLTIGNKKIYSHEWYEREFREHGGYAGGFNDIYYLEIDGTVYREE